MSFKFLGAAAALAASTGLLGGCLAVGVAKTGVGVAGAVVGTAAKGVGAAAHGVGAVVGGGRENKEAP